MASVVSQTQSASQRHFCQALTESASRGKKSPRNPGTEAQGLLSGRNLVGAELRSGRGLVLSSRQPSGVAMAVLDPAGVAGFHPQSPSTNTVPAEWRSRLRSSGAARLGRLLSAERQRLRLALLSSPCTEGDDGEPGNDTRQATQ